MSEDKTINEKLSREQGMKEWLAKNKIRKYSLIYDSYHGLMVDCAQSVTLELTGLEVIAVKFNEIYGDFNCSRNNLKSLENSPRIVHGKFNCSYNPLEGLNGGPVKVKDFFAGGCGLKSLVGAPLEVNGVFMVDGNELVNLKGAPNRCGGFFSASHNSLISLEGCPEVIEGFFCATHNKLENLIYFPEKIKEQVKLNFNDSLGLTQDKYDFKELHVMHLIDVEKQKIEDEIGLINEDGLRTLNKALGRNKI